MNKIHIQKMSLQGNINTASSPDTLLPVTASGTIEATDELEHFEQNSMIEMQSEEESLSISNLNGLIKQRRNADFKSIISSANRSDLINIGGNTLMHTAVAKNNTEIIAFLWVSGFDIDAQDTLGQTPLHYAILNSDFHAVQLLLSFEPNILLTDKAGMSPLQLCFRQEIFVPEYVIGCFLERLKRSGLSAPNTVDQLQNVGCSIEQTLLASDPEILGLMLDRQSSININDSRALIDRVLNSGYPENVGALVTRGPDADVRLKFFLHKVIECKSFPRMKFFFKLLIKRNLINEAFIRKTGNVFRYERENVVRVYSSLGIDEYARKFGWELLAELFGNCKIDCLKIVKNRQFDVNGLSINGYSALHLAVIIENKASVAYLLEIGADPNVKDSNGQTPMFNCYDDEVQELLLEAGADMQVISDNRSTIIDENISDGILANLCILEARGLLRRKLVDAVKRKSMTALLQSKFKSHRQDIEWMKTHKVSGSATLFTLLFGGVENRACYAKSEADAEAILQSGREHKLQSTYMLKLTNNLKKAKKVHELRSNAATFISGVMKIESQDHLVIEKIIDYLTYGELLVFDETGIE